MIRKLRIKLIIASMVSLFTVLLIVMGTISLLNYHGVIEDADQILGILAEIDGSFPDIPGAGERPPENDPRKKERLLSPELPYESRYFSVFLNQSGQPIATNTGKIKAVDTSTAIAYAQSIWESGRTSGFLGNYRYMVYAVQDETHMLFGIAAEILQRCVPLSAPVSLPPWQGLFQYCFYCCSCPGEL